MLQLLLDFGSFYLREQLAPLDMRANVEIPTLKVATGSRIDRRIAECLGIARQDDLLCGSAFPRKNHSDRGNGGFFGSLFESRFGCSSRMDAGVNQERKCSERGCSDKDCGSAPGSGERMRTLRIRLHGLLFDRFWVGDGLHIFLARCHWFSFNSRCNWL